MIKYLKKNSKIYNCLNKDLLKILFKEINSIIFNGR